MEETAFAELDRAAVAGAEGTAWGLPPDLSEDTGALGPMPADAYSAFSATSPFDVLPVADLKTEPALFALNAIPGSPAAQTSLCSAQSEEASSALAPRPPPPPAASIAKHRKRAPPRLAKTVGPASAAPVLSKEEMADLKGTTAARSRKMTEEERRVMLHKRRLRNRASAARSREKRSRTLNDLSAEVEELMKKAAGLAEQARVAVEEARSLKARNVLLVKENELLKAELRI